MGIVFCASQRKKPLAAMQITDKEIAAIILVVLEDEPSCVVVLSFMPRGQPISRMPAMIR